MRPLSGKWQIVVLELQIKARMMLTNVIVYPIGHYIMKTTPSIAKIANAGLVFLENTMGAGDLAPDYSHSLDDLVRAPPPPIGLPSKRFVFDLVCACTIQK